jgi:hypothetical protein
VGLLVDAFAQVLVGKLGAHFYEYCRGGLASPFMQRTSTPLQSFSSSRFVVPPEKPNFNAAQSDLSALKPEHAVMLDPASMVVLNEVVTEDEAIHLLKDAEKVIKKRRF